MALIAILDASVLYPLPLRDTLLPIAEIGAYDPRWSERILDEVARNLTAKRGATDTQTERLLNAMRRAFDTATVPEQAITRLEPAMANNPKDRHVPAVAVNARAIVTFPVLSFDLLVARVHARIWAGLASSGADVGAHDRIVAATAMSAGWRVGTANMRHFGRIPGLDARLISLT